MSDPDLKMPLYPIGFNLLRSGIGLNAIATFDAKRKKQG
jgi:hypothetical protein